jgi:hypothetical protein
MRISNRSCLMLLVLQMRLHMFLYVHATDALRTCQSEGATDAISEEGGTPKVTPTSYERVQKRPSP